jgi:enoyl-CoA hydratase/carnithine racemase
MSQHVEIVQGASWVELHLNRADKKNALTGEMYEALALGLSAANIANGDPKVRSVILAGKGSAFCAGNDLQDFLTTPLDMKSPVLSFLEAIANIRCPLIAAVQGPAVGVGATMLLHCDYVVAAPSAALQFSFAKMALVPEAASSLLLPRVVGHLKASELMLLGDPVPAEEALRLGLVNKVVGEGEQLEAARAFAARVGALPPQAVDATKYLLKRDTEGVTRRMQEEFVEFGRQLKSAEFKEAVSAFMQKRAPKWGG